MALRVAHKKSLAAIWVRGSALDSRDQVDAVEGDEYCGFRGTVV